MEYAVHAQYIFSGFFYSVLYLWDIIMSLSLSVVSFLLLSYFIFWLYHNLFNLFYSWTSGSFPLSFNNFSTEKNKKSLTTKLKDFFISILKQNEIPKDIFQVDGKLFHTEGQKCKTWKKRGKYLDNCKCTFTM